MHCAISDYSTELRARVLSALISIKFSSSRCDLSASRALIILSFLVKGNGDWVGLVMYFSFAEKTYFSNLSFRDEGLPINVFFFDTLFALTTCARLCTPRTTSKIIFPERFGPLYCIIYFSYGERLK